MQIDELAHAVGVKDLELMQVKMDVERYIVLTLWSDFMGLCRWPCR